MGSLKRVLLGVFYVISYFLNAVEPNPIPQEPKSQEKIQSPGFDQNIQHVQRLQLDPAFKNKDQSQLNQNAPQFLSQGQDRLKKPNRSMFDQIVQQINSGHRARAKVNPNYNPNIPTESHLANVRTDGRSGNQIVPSIVPQFLANTKNASKQVLPLLKRNNNDIQMQTLVTTETSLNKIINNIELEPNASNIETEDTPAIRLLEKIIEDHKRTNMEYQEEQLRLLEVAKAQLEKQIKNQKELEAKWQKRISEENKKSEYENENDFKMTDEETTTKIINLLFSNDSEKQNKDEQRKFQFNADKEQSQEKKENKKETGKLQTKKTEENVDFEEENENIDESNHSPSHHNQTIETVEYEGSRQEINKQETYESNTSGKSDTTTITNEAEFEETTVPSFNTHANMIQTAEKMLERNIPNEVKDAIQLVSRYFNPEKASIENVPEYVWTAVQELKQFLM